MTTDENAARTASPHQAATEEDPVTVKTSYAPGEPIWVDLSTPDVDKSTAFYGALFGWECNTSAATTPRRPRPW